MLACSLVTRTCFLKWDLTLAHWTQVSDRCPMGYLILKPSDTLHTHWHIEHLHKEIWCHKKTFWQNDSVLNLARFLTLFLNVGLCSDSACMGKSTCTRAFTEAICFFAYTIHNVDALNICTKKFDAIKILFWTKWQHFELGHFLTLCFLIRVLLVLRSCTEKSTCTIAFTEAIWYFAYAL